MRRALLPALLLLLLAFGSAAASAPDPSPALPLVVVHPDGELHVGDQLSFEVIAPAGMDVSGSQAQVWAGLPGEIPLASARFERFGIAGRLQATLFWAWDTAQAGPGYFPLTFAIAPGGPVWVEWVHLLPPAAAPGQWAQAQSECCIVHYITGTAADRHLSALLAQADAQADAASRLLKAGFEKPVELTFLGRVLGHGGFASGGISISYLDRNYVGGDLGMILRHELIHILDARLGGELRPALLIEGLAVYLSGGHYQPGPLLPRAAALLELGLYQPLDRLANRFYPSQHEAGYIQAGALVGYMVDRWGWQPFESFYRDIHPVDGGRPAAAIEQALSRHFDTSLDQLDEDFRGYLQAHPAPPADLANVRLTVDLYDTLRRYQQALDPSAYYLTAWLPDGDAMRQRMVTADLLRAPAAPPNIILESLLMAAGESLQTEDAALTRQLIDAINAALDRLEPPPSNQPTAR